MSDTGRKKLAATLTKELRTVKDKASLVEFIRKIDKIGEGFALHSKRKRKHSNGPWCFDFTEHPYRKGYAHYLMNDGISSGTCRWENLYRVLVVR